MPLAISPPTTDIEIISMACMLNGKGKFNTIASGGSFAESAQDFYYTLVSAELGSTRWRFAQQVQAMGVLTTLSPNFDGWEYYWTLPADCLMFQRPDPLVNWTIFGGRFLTNTNQSLNAIYLRAVPVSEWQPAFALYMVYALAANLAISVSENAQLEAKINALKMEWESRALFADSQSAPGRPLASTPWVSARFDYRTGISGNGRW